MIASLKSTREKKARIQARLSRSRTTVAQTSYSLPLLLAAALWLGAISLLHFAQELGHTQLYEGQRAPATLIAQVDFEVPDLSATELARRQAADAVPPYFSLNNIALQSALRAVDQIFDRLVELRQPNENNALRETPLEVAGLVVTTHDLETLAPAGQEEDVRGAIRQSLQSVWPQGIVSPSDRESLFHGIASGGLLTITTPDQPVSPPVQLTELYTSEEATRAALTRIRHALGDVVVNDAVLRNVVRALIQPNLSYDVAQTDLSRQQAQRTVRPIMKLVRAGATVMNQGDRISAQQLEEWRTHERRLSELQTPRDRQLQWMARSFLLLFALVICSGLLQIVRPDIVQSPSRILLLVLTSLLSLLAVAGILYTVNNTTILRPSLVEFMLPLALAPILITTLIGPSTAVVIGVWTSFASAVMFDNSFSIFALGLLVTIIAVHVARNVRTRARMLRIGLWVGLAQVVYGMSMAALNLVPLNLLAQQALVAMVGGLVTALLALIFLPLFESLFDITTDITLLELSDMGHPLLQRLAMEAPGTYHHSLMVANLAQAAAAEINANPLLVRVCAYFHDIGKLTKPEFFVENTQFRENPHDDLSPSMSTLVIISHVKEGVSMARRAKLPRPIIEAIEQHHGTSLVAYFYHRAKTQQSEKTGNGSDRGVSETDYRYPGPTPRTPEMGILLLADSVEAASRSMEKPTPSRIENLVQEIIDSRLQDNQLDDCDLTFAQLKAIKRSFIFTLTNMLHGRVPYPKDENNNKESATPVSAPGKDLEGVREPHHEGGAGDRPGS